MNYGITLKEKPFDYGLTRQEVVDLFDMLNQTEAYPIELMAMDHECSAMGFIAIDAADQLNYNYSELEKFVANILDDMENESDDCRYEFKGISIWLSR